MSQPESAIDGHASVGHLPGSQEETYVPAKAVTATGFVGVCVDAFFFYIASLSHANTCLGINTNLWKVAVALRTAPDIITFIIFCSMSKNSILLICVTFLSVVPVPQTLFSEKFILKTLEAYTFWNFILFFQYGARLVLIFLSCKQLEKSVSPSDFPLLWIVSVYLFLYFIVSHLLGASWYHLSIKRQLSCWNHACKINAGCIFPCDGTTSSTLNSTLVNKSCPINPPNATVFDLGIYTDALQSGIVEGKDVLKKFLRSFRWGIGNLSTFASNLHTSTDNWETIFAIMVFVVAFIVVICILDKIRLAFSDAERVSVPSTVEGASVQGSANSATEGVDGSNSVESTVVQRTVDIEMSNLTDNSATEGVDGSNSVPNSEESSSVQGSTNSATERVDGSNSVQSTVDIEMSNLRIIGELYGMIVNAFIRKTADSATEGVYSSSLAEEGPVRREIEEV